MLGLVVLTSLPKNPPSFYATLLRHASPLHCISSTTILNSYEGSELDIGYVHKLRYCYLR